MTTTRPHPIARSGGGSISGNRDGTFGESLCPPGCLPVSPSTRGPSGITWGPERIRDSAYLRPGSPDHHPSPGLTPTQPLPARAEPAGPAVGIALAAGMAIVTLSLPPPGGPGASPGLCPEISRPPRATRSHPHALSRCPDLAPAGWPPRVATWSGGGDTGNRDGTFWESLCPRMPPVVARSCCSAVRSRGPLITPGGAGARFPYVS